MIKWILLVFLVVGLVGCGPSDEAIQRAIEATAAAAPTPTVRPTVARATATPGFADAYEMFREVRNDCGVCGSDSPIGGWEAKDGRTLVLAEHGEFLLTAPNGVTTSGKWRLRDGELCLDLLCLEYEQRVDAMRLGSRIYIRY